MSKIEELKKKNKDMKTTISRYWFVVMATLSLCLTTACSDDDDDAAVTPVFPQVQKLAGAAGDIIDFTFEANQNWSLSSNAIWCKLQTDDADSQFVVNGTPGRQTVKVLLTADDEAKELTVTQLYLTMGGEKVAVAEVQRSASGYSVSVFDEAGNDITSTGIVVGYDKYVKFSVKANYRFAVTNTPEWVELEGGFMVGRAGELTVGGAMFKEGVRNAKYAISIDEGETITIASQDGKAMKTIPVRFNGMPTNTMDIVYPTSSPWADWTVSLDGKTFSQTGSTGITGNGGNDTFTFSNFVPFTLKTAADDFTLVVFQTESWGMEPCYDHFVKASGENGDIRITVDALDGGERDCYVYALPKAVYESLSNLYEMFDEEGNVSWLYNPYFLMHFVQKEQSGTEADSKAPTVLVGGWKEVDCKKETTGIYNEVAANYLGYSGDEIYVATVSVGDYVTITPNIASYEPQDLSDIFGLSSWGTSLVPEVAMDTNDTYTFSYKVTDEAPFFIAFRQNGTTLKVLVLERDDY